MDKTKNVLFWWMFTGFAVMLIWLGFIIFAGEAMHSFHAEIGTVRMLPLELFMMANYVGIGMWKMGVIRCFSIP